MEITYNYPQVFEANKTGQPCGEINNEWIACYNSDLTLKCCSDIKSGYTDLTYGAKYFS